MDFRAKLQETAGKIEVELVHLLEGEMVAGTPERLLQAMRHAMLGGGKRLRPFLALETSALFDIPQTQALAPALAVELIHGYSLVHDDLPAMDNDTLRRGQPTVWAKFDDWTSILAGDALQALAFEVLATCGDISPTVRAKLAAALAKASGARGMVGGQALDLEADKLNIPKSVDTTHIKRLQAMKTGALIAYACEAGAVLAEAEPAHHEALASYGRHLGYAFQIADDLLDVEGDAATVGKAVAKDAAAGKATLVSLMGIAEAKAELAATVSAAKDALGPFGEKAEVLRQTAEFVATRQS
ncbi:MAG: polyprenyl synthetase family protein [Filomicrobium sp.]